MQANSRRLSPQEKKELRKKIRAKRRSLTTKERKKANDLALNYVKRSHALWKGQFIALYIGSDGEICPKSLLATIRRWKKKSFLPVLHPVFKNRMVFCEVNDTTHLKPNGYGIPEPDFKHSRHLKPRFLSTVLTPLVAFDQAGNRMGMGGGFYDRTFAFKRRPNSNTPKLIGLAHDFQKVEKLPCESWDIPLNGVITDQRFYEFKR